MIIIHVFFVLGSINEYFDDFDETCIAFGTTLLDLCILNNLWIVNDRLSSDFNIGSYKYVTVNGTSGIDYLLTHEKNFKFLIYVIFVLSANERCDHTPVSFFIVL